MTKGIFRHEGTENFVCLDCNVRWIGENIVHKCANPPSDPVTKPAHYTAGGLETIDYIEAKGLGYNLGNVVKYISRAGIKDASTHLQDLKKAAWYLNREIIKQGNK